MRRPTDHEKEVAYGAFAEFLGGVLRDRGYDIDSPRGGGKTRLATETGLSQAAVGRMLRGETMPELDTMITLCRVLEVSLATMLERAGKLDPGEFAQSVRNVAHQAVSSRELTPAQAMDAWGIHDQEERDFLETAIRRARKAQEQEHERFRHPRKGDAAEG